MTRQDPFNVLFLCVGNSARSILAESIVNRDGGDRFQAFSAGSHPKGLVHPHTLDLLATLKYPTEGLHSKSWDKFATENLKLDFVFTVCDDAAGETCPAFPGQPMSAHWGVPDPAVATGTEAEKRLAFADAFRMLNGRIQAFMNLPIASLDRTSLQHRVDAIGRSGQEAGTSAA